MSRGQNQIKTDPRQDGWMPRDNMRSCAARTFDRNFKTRDDDGASRHHDGITVIIVHHHHDHDDDHHQMITVSGIHLSISSSGSGGWQETTLEERLGWLRKWRGALLVAALLVQRGRTSWLLHGLAGLL
jgi:hypothetical protein